MRIKQILPGLFQISLRLSNAYLAVHRQELVLIDTGNPGEAELIEQAIESIGASMSDVQHVIITHCHPDHAGSLAALQATYDFTTYMHPLEAQLAREGRPLRSTLSAGPGALNKLIYRFMIASIPNHIDPCRIDVEVNDGDVLPVAGGMRLIHAPGHCAGQIMVLWEKHDGVLFVADTAVHVTNLAPAPVYEDYQLGKKTLQNIGQLDFATACFGHGRPIRNNGALKFRQRWPK